MTPEQKTDYDVYRVVISGGVADYVYSDFEPVAIADMTQIRRYWSRSRLVIRKSFAKAGVVLEQPMETIRVLSSAPGFIP